MHVLACARVWVRAGGGGEVMVVVGGLLHKAESNPPSARPHVEIREHT